MIQSAAPTVALETSRVTVSTVAVKFLVFRTIEVSTRKRREMPAKPARALPKELLFADVRTNANGKAGESLVSGSQRM
jgi:hypothetical protein